MAREHEFAKLAHTVAAEMSGDVPKIGQTLFGTPLPDSRNLSQQAYSDVIQRAYQRGDRQYLMALANADPAQFNGAYKALGGQDVPLPPQPSNSTI